jgi:hypothetical protein
MNLPTFEEMRRNARRLLGDAQDELLSDFASGRGPTIDQANAMADACHHIALAEAALDRAARG